MLRLYTGIQEVEGWSLERFLALLDGEERGGHGCSSAASLIIHVLIPISDSWVFINNDNCINTLTDIYLGLGDHKAGARCRLCSLQSHCCSWLSLPSPGPPSESWVFLLRSPYNSPHLPPLPSSKWHSQLGLKWCLSQPPTASQLYHSGSPVPLLSHHKGFFHTSPCTGFPVSGLPLPVPYRLPLDALLTPLLHQVDCLHTHWGFYDCCHHHTLSLQLHTGSCSCP